MPIQVFFNDKSGADSEWRFVESERVPPMTSLHGVCLRRTSIHLSPILRSALLHGIFLKKDEVQACLLSEGIDIPQGRALKNQLVDLLIDGILPDIDEDRDF